MDPGAAVRHWGREYKLRQRLHRAPWKYVGPPIVPSHLHTRNPPLSNLTPTLVHHLQSLGTATLRGVQFGVATSTEDQFAGILGLGHGHGYMTTYRTFLDELVFQNVTTTRAFSLGLGAKDSGEGSITFGGVDTAKFAGGLAPVPIIPGGEAPDGVSRYWVQLEGISLSPPNSSAGEAYNGSQTAVFLDSGATLTLLPPALASSIAADFGSPGEDEGGFFPVDCGLVGLEGTLDFIFEGVTVKVPYREMIRDLRNPERCYLGIVPSEEFALLGDTFLRSAYGMPVLHFPIPHLPCIPFS